MPILIGVSPWANDRIGGENSGAAPSAAPACTRRRRVILRTISTLPLRARISAGWRSSRPTPVGLLGRIVRGRASAAVLAPSYRRAAGLTLQRIIAQD